MKKVLSVVVLIINIVFVVLYFVSTLAGVVKPSQCVWVSLLSYCYVVFLVINVGFVLFWLFFSNKYFLVSLLAILVRYAFVPLYYQTSGTDNPTDERFLRLMTFNVHHFTREDDACLQTITLVDDKNPDVICFQEFASKPGKISVYDTLRMRGYKYNYSHVKWKNTPRGTTIFSKYPIISKGRVDSNRCIYVDLKLSNDTLRVYNVHLASYKLDNEDKDELERLKHGDMTERSEKTLHKFKTTALAHEAELEQLISHIASSPYRSVMCGDLNDTPASYTYQQLKDLYVDSFVKKGEGLSTTYNGVFPAFRIDYILHHKGLITDSYKRLKVDISDHYPVFVSIEIPELCNSESDTDA